MKQATDFSKIKLSQDPENTENDYKNSNRLWENDVRWLNIVETLMHKIVI